MRILLKIFFTQTILFLSFTSFSQVNDAGLWLSVGVEKNISQSFSVQFGHCSRFNENISELGSFLNEIGVNYKLNKKNQLSLFYRNTNSKLLDNTYSQQHRFYLDYTYKTKLNNLVLSFRLRAQVQSYYLFMAENDQESKSMIRPKLCLKYPVSIAGQKFVPFISAEGFKPLFYNKYRPIDKVRFCVGIGYNINNAHSIELSYLIQKEFYQKNPLSDYVIGLDYKYSF
jgi:hypothetical protein